MSSIFSHRFDNGLQLVAEPIAGVRSAALSLVLPCGIAHEAEGRQGAATLFAEMAIRGAGELDARAHSEALDFLGVQRGLNAGGIHARLSASMIGEKLPEALPLLLDMALRPHLPEASLEPSRMLALQTLDALEDEPQQKVMLELRSRHLPEPFGRPLYGRREDIEKMTLDDVKTHWRQTVVPDGAILGIAGCFDEKALVDQVGELTRDWRGKRDDPDDAIPPARGYEPIKAETTQVHIGVAYDAVSDVDDDAILQRTAVSILSGGMSGRLFTEVREKRGLCYAVSARYGADKRRGMVQCYSGTKTERAQETLDVMVGELRRLSEGAEQDEFDRAIVGMKSRLVMQGESTSARAAAIAGDQYLFGRPRTLDERADEVAAVTLDRVNDFVAANVPGELTIVTIGPEVLRAP